MNALLKKQQAYILTSFLSVFCVFFSGIIKSNLLLEIKFKNCRGNVTDYLSNITLIKDGEVVRSLEPGFNSPQILTDLDTGTYYLEYWSWFGKKEILKVSMPNFEKYSVVLCVDYLDYSKETYKPVIDQLQDKENYEIIMSSRGCFHSYADTITISREKDSYFAKCSSKQKTLSLSDIDAVRHFEIELNYMNKGLCTTVDTYIVKYGKKLIEINDASCDWNGSTYLKEKLWGK